MKIIRLTLENVGNIKKASYDLKNVNVFEADNGVGKSNTLNALAFLLSKRIMTDSRKNETEFTDLIPNTDEKAVCKVEIEVETGATFGFEFYNKFTKKRGSNEIVFDGRTTDYFYNKVKCKNIKEFNSEFYRVFEIESISQIKVNDSKFNPLALITDVFYALNKVDYKILREIVSHFVGNVTFEEMIEKEPLLATLSSDRIKYNGRFDLARKNYKSLVDNAKSKAQILEETIKNISCTYDEERYKTLEQKRLEIEQQLFNNEQYSVAILESEKALNEAKSLYLDSRSYDLTLNKNKELEAANDNVLVLRNKKSACEATITSYQRNMDSLRLKGQMNKNTNSTYETQINALLEQYTLISNQILEVHTCPNCGFTLDSEEEITKRKLEKSSKLTDLQNKIENLKRMKACNIEATKKVISEMDNLQGLISNANSDLENINKELQEASMNLEKIKKLPFDPISEKTRELERVYKEKQEYHDNLIIDFNTKKEEMKSLLDAQLKAVNEELNPILGAIANAQNKMKLENELEEVISIQNNNEMMYSLCDMYIKESIKAISEKTKEILGIEFQMLEEQVNGGLAEVCYPVVDGKPYSQLNMGLKEIIGAKFIRAIENLLGIKEFPILIDNAESLGTNSLRELRLLGNQLVLTRVVPGLEFIKFVEE